MTHDGVCVCVVLVGAEVQLNKTSSEFSWEIEYATTDKNILKKNIHPGDLNQKIFKCVMKPQ